MAQFVQVIKLQAASESLRDEIVKRISDISTYAQKSEPGTTKYAVCVPRDAGEDKTTCWIIEEYITKNAHAEHRSAPLVQDLLKWVGSGDVLAGPMEHLKLNYVRDLAEYAFTRPAVKSLNDPYITFVSIEYNPGKRDQALASWKKVCDEAMDESGTFVYALAIDEAKNDDVLYTLQAYESEQYLTEVHLKQNKAVKDSEATLDSSVNVKHNVLKLTGGHLSR